MAGILSTVILHMSLLIIFMIFKIQGLYEQRELGITLDFTQENTEEIINPPEKLKLTPGELAYLERLLSQTGNMSNIAARLENEISTRNYVDMVEKELDQSRSEEWRKQQEEIQNKLNQEDFVPEDNSQPRDIEMDDYTGPSNITYEFLESPVNRQKVYLPVPVYKCQGDGTVHVEVTVDQSGRVLTARAFAQQNFPDKDCILEVAERYAFRSRFEGDLSAPKAHKARIIYKFIAQ